MDQANHNRKHISKNKTSWANYLLVMIELKLIFKTTVNFSTYRDPLNLQKKIIGKSIKYSKFIEKLSKKKQ